MAVVAKSLAEAEEPAREMEAAEDSRASHARRLTQWTESPELAVAREILRRTDTEEETGELRREPPIRPRRISPISRRWRPPMLRRRRPPSRLPRRSRRSRKSQLR